MEAFKVGDYVYAEDRCCGQIVEIEDEIAYVQFKTESGGGCLPFDLSELEHEKWCITTDDIDYDGTAYLGWQNPACDEAGYFWTSKEIIKGIMNTNNTPEHPFIFNSRKAAIRHLKTLFIPQQCKVVRLY